MMVADIALPNLLLVDDSRDNLIMLEHIVGKLNINLITAISGSEALDRIRGIELALAIIDVQMPLMNGYELVEIINRERKGDRVPIIFLTANYFDESEVFKGYTHGAVDYIFKPINNHILLSKISVFLDLFNQKQTIIRNAELLRKSSEELTRVHDALQKSEEKYLLYIDMPWMECL